MATWYKASPYFWFGEYMGGNDLGCSPNLTKSWVSTIDGQGWDQLPLWVSYQAPDLYFGTYPDGEYCNGTNNEFEYGNMMSSNVNTAYTLGYDSAYDAEQAAVALGYSSGSIIYDDVEAYDNAQSACQLPVRHFVNGWCWRLTQDGWKCGMYGSSSGSDMSDWAYNISNPPNDVYAAEWNGKHKHTAWGLGGLSDSSDWYYGQRTHQYEGTHDETWPKGTGIQLSIDAGCSIGMVANSSPSSEDPDGGGVNESNSASEDPTC